MRVRLGKARHRSKKRLFKEARGNVGGRSKLLRTVKETLIRARAFATRDRRTRKREFRALWITRITAAVRERGMSYSTFIHGLVLANQARVPGHVRSEDRCQTPFDPLFLLRRHRSPCR